MHYPKLGLIHVTDGIVLRGGLDQPKADLPQPDTSNAMKLFTFNFKYFTAVSFSILILLFAL